MIAPKIIVRTPNWLGDTIIALPALRALRENFRDSKIALLAKRSVADVYEREKLADMILPFDGDRFNTAVRLRRGQFDLGILLTNSFDSALLFRMAGVDQIVGYASDRRGFLLTHPVEWTKYREVNAHERYYYLEMLQKAHLLDAYHAADKPIRMACSEEAAAEGRRIFAENGVRGRVIGVSPGAAYGGAKCWLPERFGEVATNLAREMGGSVILFGAANDRDVCEGVARNIREVPVFNLAGRTNLRKFIDMAAACTLFLTNDSGGMHVASALGVPTVAIFGPTSPITTGPAGPRNAVIQEPVDCAPCFKRECPIDHRCMVRVTSERVMQSSLQLLQLQVTSETS